jgi:hypothetical protein
VKELQKLIDENEAINDDLKRTLVLLLDQAGDDVRRARESLEKWFDNVMERTSGWYKRTQGRNILIIALILTVLLNADTFMIGSVLARDPELRASVTAAAVARVQQPSPTDGSPPSAQDAVNRARTEIEALGLLGLPMGWTGQLLPWVGVAQDTPPMITDAPRDLGGWARKLIGLLVTAAALSFGAPFWFDMLNKVTNLRAAGQPPKKTGETPDDTATRRV